MGATFTHAWKSAMLQDGRVVIAGYDQTQIAIKCFDPVSTTQDWFTPLTGEIWHSSGEISEIIVLTNNNIVVAWADQAGRGWLVILDSDGNVIVSKREFDGGVNASAASYSMVALPDGGFAMKYEQYPGGPGDWDFISIRNADGSSRVTNFYPAYEDYSAFTKIDCFPSGNLFVPAPNDTFVYIYDPTTGAELVNGINDDQYYSSQVQGYYNIKTAKLSSWTDKIAIFFGNDVNKIWASHHIDYPAETWWEEWDKEVYSGGPGVRLIDVVPLGEYFILQFKDTNSAIQGDSYIILDGSFNLVSGPHTLFTSQSDVKDEGWLKGCSIG
jgi:hypothetical protein